MTERVCKHCSAYAPLGNGTGTCRANPPTPFPTAIMNAVSQRPEMRLMGGWPPTSDQDWCRDGWKPSKEIVQ